MKESLSCRGDVQAIIQFSDGRTESIEFNNSILRTGRIALAKSLGNMLDSDYDFFISKMVFGNGGTAAGTNVPKTVLADRTSLFGTQVVVKPVIANLDVNNNSQIIFTSVISYDEGNDFVLNEMALRMNNGELYSMATFPGVTKTSQMQLTWNWRLSFI
jgi:hypothetical protein